MAVVKPVRRTSVRLSQERRVADIMSAARRVIAQRGYENALMSEIAEQAGIVEGSLYRYFENKRDLLTKVVDDWFEEVLSTDSGLASIRRDPDYRHSRSFQLNRRFTAEVSEVFESAMAAGEFRRDVSVTLLRDMVFGCIEHSTWKFLRGEGDFAIDEVADGIATLIVRGMAAEAPRSVDKLDDIAARLEKTAANMEQLIASAK
jgi:AcrR family transcriptional regulator